MQTVILVGKENTQIEWYFCSLGPHLEKTIKMFTYDDQTLYGLSTTTVLCVCICHVIKK